MANLTDTKDFLIRCINSCRTQEQITICEEMEQTYIVKPFEVNTGAVTMDLVRGEIKDALDERKKIVANSVLGMTV